jgi:YqxM protein
LIVPAIKGVLLWYTTIITAMYFTNSTNALFTDTQETISTFQAGTWGKESWDNSSIEFLKKNYGFCLNGDGKFTSSLRNKGEDMEGPTSFRVYFQPEGSSAPNQNGPGIQLYEGELAALTNKQVFLLEYLPTSLPEAGKYKFMAFHRSGHPGNETFEGRMATWGEEINISSNDINTCSFWNSSTSPDDESKENKKNQDGEIELQPIDKKNETVQKNEIKQGEGQPEPSNPPELIDDTAIDNSNDVDSEKRNEKEQEDEINLDVQAEPTDSSELLDNTTIEIPIDNEKNEN